MKSDPGRYPSLGNRQLSSRRLSWWRRRRRGGPHYPVRGGGFWVLADAGSQASRQESLSGDSVKLDSLGFGSVLFESIEPISQ